MKVINGFNFDENNLIVQADGDGGDTAQRTGMYYLGLYIRSEYLGLDNLGYGFSTRQDFENALTLLEVKPGIYVRHPTQWNDPNDFSRDQQTPLVIAMGFYKMTSRLTRLYSAQRRRFFSKYQNKDFPTPEHMNFYSRAFNNCCGFEPEKSYAVGDSLQYLNSLLLCKKAQDPNWVDDLNHILSLLQATLIKPTKISQAALSYYVKNRPKSLGSPFEKNNILAALTWYNRADSGGNPGFVELYRPIIERFFHEGRFDPKVIQTHLP